MKSFSNANKALTWALLTLLLAIPLQIWINYLLLPDFVKDSQTVIHKTIVSYGKERDDNQSRTIEYHLEPYLWNRYVLLASIQFDHGEKLKTQFLITFWPSQLYSIQYISQLVEAEEVKYFDPPEQHVLFDGGDENFQVLVESDRLYCYIQLSNQAVQCVDVKKAGP
jgi:hypothetical protein